MRKWDIGTFLSGRLTSFGTLKVTYEPIEEFAWRLRFQSPQEHFLGFMHFTDDAKEGHTAVVISIRIGRMMPESARAWLTRQIKRYQRDGYQPLFVGEENGKLNLASAMQIVIKDTSIDAALSGGPNSIGGIVSSTTTVIQRLLQDFRAGHAIADGYRQVN